MLPILNCMIVWLFVAQHPIIDSPISMSVEKKSCVQTGSIEEGVLPHTFWGSHERTYKVSSNIWIEPIIGSTHNTGNILYMSVSPHALETEQQHVPGATQDIAHRNHIHVDSSQTHNGNVAIYIELQI